MEVAQRKDIPCKHADKRRYKYERQARGKRHKERYAPHLGPALAAARPANFAGFTAEASRGMQTAPQETYDLHKSAHFGGEFDVRDASAVNEAPQRKARRVAVVPSGLDAVAT